MQEIQARQQLVHEALANVFGQSPVLNVSHSFLQRFCVKKLYDQDSLCWHHEKVMHLRDIWVFQVAKYIEFVPSYLLMFRIARAYDFERNFETAMSHPRPSHNARASLPGNFQHLIFLGESIA